MHSFIPPDKLNVRAFITQKDLVSVRNGECESQKKKEEQSWIVFCLWEGGAS